MWYANRDRESYVLNATPSHRVAFVFLDNSPDDRYARARRSP